MKYEAVIGLEIHCELKTKTKIFCGCATGFGADQNTHVCPVCLGMPGVLPCVNRRVVEFGIKAEGEACRDLDKAWDEVLQRLKDVGAELKDTPD